MAFLSFVPTIWSARLLENLRKTLVYTQPGIVNRDYEGEISQVGDSVRISLVGPVSTADYTRDVDINAPEALTDAQMALVIERAKYFNFSVDDVDKIQSRPMIMDAAMQEAAYALADAADLYVAGFHAQVATANFIGTEAAPKTDLGTAGKAYEYLVDLGVLLTDAKVPTAARWVIVPPWFYGLLLKDDRFVKAGTPTSDMVLRNGEVGQAAGFRVLQSHNVPNTAGLKHKILAGTSAAISFAEQINKVEAYRPERRFADAVKGLHLYGGKVLRPSGLAVLVANKP